MYLLYLSILYLKIQTCRNTKYIYCVVMFLEHVNDVEIHFVKNMYKTLSVNHRKCTKSLVQIIHNLVSITGLVRIFQQTLVFQLWW